MIGPILHESLTKVLGRYREKIVLSYSFLDLTIPNTETISGWYCAVEMGKIPRTGPILEEPHDYRLHDRINTGNATSTFMQHRRHVYLREGNLQILGQIFAGLPEEFEIFSQQLEDTNFPYINVSSSIEPTVLLTFPAAEMLKSLNVQLKKLSEKYREKLSKEVKKFSDGVKRSMPPIGYTRYNLAYLETVDEGRKKHGKRIDIERKIEEQKSRIKEPYRLRKYRQRRRHNRGLDPWNPPGEKVW